MLRLVTFKVDEELLEKIDKIALFYGRNRSEVIRKALEVYVKLVEGKSSVDKVDEVNVRIARVERLRIW